MIDDRFTLSPTKSVYEQQALSTLCGISIGICNAIVVIVIIIINGNSSSNSINRDSGAGNTGNSSNSGSW